MQKLIIGFEGTPVIVRVVAHKTDDKLVCLKANDPISGSALLFALGCAGGERVQGQNYFITMVNRTAFFNALQCLDEIELPGLQQAIQKAQDMLNAENEDCIGAAVPTVGEIFELKEGPAPKLLPAKAKADKCEDCGCADGTHWNFCSMNKH